MSETLTLSGAQSYDRLVIASANLLIETNTSKDRHLRVPSQHVRTVDHLAAFKEIERRLGRRIDLLGLQELQVDDLGNVAHVLQSGLRLPFEAHHPHSRKSAGENIGVAGITPDEYEFVELGKNRFAPLLRLGELAVMFVHMSYSDKQRRKHEYETLMEIVDEEDNIVVAGDFNEEPHIFSSRRRLARVGLQSAFVLDRHQYPVTLPAPGYGQLRTLGRQVGYVLKGGGLQFDDIYVKGELRVKRTGTVDSASDHRFPYAEVVGPAGLFGTSNR